MIINPTAGKAEPILNTINKVFHKQGIDWQVNVTKKFADRARLAKSEVLTFSRVMDAAKIESAKGIMGSETPMTILPGETGIAVSFKLKVQRNLRQAV